jgi:hypothetical protein
MTTPRNQRSTRLLPAGIILALFLVTGCAKSAPAAGGGGSGLSSVRIERTYMLLNASPFQMQTDAAVAASLYADVRALGPDSGKTACPGDTGVHYTLTFLSGSKVLLKATAIHGGCRVVLVNGKAYSGTGTAAKAFWSALFQAVGPAGQPGAGSGSPGSAS